MESEFKLESYPSSAALLTELTEVLEDAFQKRASTVGADLFRQMGRFILLQVMDTAWVDHLTYLEQLRKGIFLRAYGQKDPLIEFQKEGFALFEGMMQRIREETLEYMFHLEAAPQSAPAERVMLLEKPESPDVAGEASRSEPARAVRPAPLIATARPNGKNPPAAPVAALPTVKTIGRNDPCPCGSGKKYKKCCGK